MDLGLKDKIVLVTGASKGIGRAIALAFAAEGSTVILNARNQTELAKVTEEVRQLGGQAIAVPADIANSAEAQGLIERVLAEVGTLHVLVNNVGGADGFVPFEELSDENWLNVFHLNVLSTVRLIRGFLPHMRQQRWGRIINISSEVGSQPDPLMPHYNAAKAAINNLTKSLSRIYGNEGILVNTVSPGWTRTPLTEGVFTIQAKEQGITLQEFEEKFLREHRAHLTIKRAGKPEEVASAVVYLASESASFVTGTNLHVDGGAVIGL